MRSHVAVTTSAFKAAGVEQNTTRTQNPTLMRSQVVNYTTVMMLGTGWRFHLDLRLSPGEVGT